MEMIETVCERCGIHTKRSKSGGAKYCLTCIRVLDRERSKNRMILSRERKRKERLNEKTEEL